MPHPSLCSYSSSSSSSSLFLPLFLFFSSCFSPPSSPSFSAHSFSSALPLWSARVIQGTLLDGLDQTQELKDDLTCRVGGGVGSKTTYMGQFGPNSPEIETPRSELQALGAGFEVHELTPQGSQPPTRHIHLVTHSTSPLHISTMTPRSSSSQVWDNSLSNPISVRQHTHQSIPQTPDHWPSMHFSHSMSRHGT